MRRRKFVGLLCGAAAAWPVSTRAQQPKRTPVVGILALTPPTTANHQAFLQGLRDLGWMEGQNINIEYRWAPLVNDLPELAAQLVRMNVDVIFAASSTQVEPARQATNTIPIVFAAHADPVGVGHVASLAHPGGNITGLSQLITELASKGLELLKEVVPKALHVGVLWNPNTPSHAPALKSIKAAAEKLGVQLHIVASRSADEFDGALFAMSQAGINDSWWSLRPSSTSNEPGWQKLHLSIAWLACSRIRKTHTRAVL